ncbi:MAG TPA: YncE family protein, partial [Thermoplasmata archaeon]|nr:YncE family protein [Thermoplasmata archaeon]
RLYVANLGSDSVSVIVASSRALLASVVVGVHPVGLVVDNQSGRLFVAQYAEGQVDMLDLGTLGTLGRVSVGAGPFGLAVDSSTGEVFVTDSQEHNVTVLNGTSGRVVRVLPVGQNPEGIAFDASVGYVYVANSGSGNLSVIDGSTDTVVGSVPAGTCPASIASDRATGEIYVGEPCANEVVVLDGATGAIVATVPTGNSPEAVTVDGLQGRVYVANQGSDNVSVLDPATHRVVASLRAGAGPDGATFDAASDEVYIANFGSNNLTVINATSISAVGAVPVGSGPSWAQTDPASGIVYATNFGSGSVSLVSPLSTVRFLRSGLPMGTPWTVRLGSSNQSTNATVLPFEEPVGSYPFSVSAPPGYVSLPSAGSVEVTGRNQTIALAFNATFPVRFDETGLPLSSNSSSGGAPYWSVELGGVLHNSTGPAIVVVLPNGTYGYVADFPSSPGYAVPLSGIVTVRGGGTQVTLAFNRAVFPVVFQESGLPNGTIWQVVLGGSAQSSATSQVSFLEPEGTYAFSVPYAGSFAPAVAHGNVSVHGFPQNLTLSFTTTLQIRSFLLSPSNLTLGSPTTVSVNTSGGTAPLHYVYTGFPAGCPPSDRATWSCTPGATGTWVVTVTVTDASGARASASALLTVTIGTRTTGVPPGVWVAIGVAIVTVLLVIAGVARWNREGPSAAPAPSEPAYRAAARTVRPNAEGPIEPAGAYGADRGGTRKPSPPESGWDDPLSGLI